MYSSTSTMKSGRGYSRGGHYTKRGGANNRTSTSSGLASQQQANVHGSSHHYQQHHNAHRGGHHSHGHHGGHHNSHAPTTQHASTGNTIGERQWQESLDTLQQIAAEGSENDVEAQNALNESLDALNKLTYPLSLKADLFTSVIVHWCTVLENIQEAESDVLASKFCRLVATLAVKQDLIYSEADGTKLVTYLVHIAKVAHTWLLVDSLRTLSYVLLDAASKIKLDLHKQVLHLVLPLARLSNADIEARKQAINCLGNMCTKTGPLLTEYYASIFNVLYDNFESYAKQLYIDYSMQKMLNNTMRSMCNVITESKEIPRVDDLVSHLKKMMLFGTKLVPAPSAELKKAAKQEPDLVFTSDSDFSSADDGASVGGLDGGKDTMRIRIQAIQMINVMAKSNLKSMFAEWKNLVPEQPGLLVPNPKYSAFTLSTVLLFDPCSRCRSAAAQAYSALLENSRLYLAQCDDAVTKAAFTPFSQTLFAMVREIHNTFIMSVEKEQSSPVTVQVLKAFSALIENVPYEKFKKYSVLPQIIAILHKLILSADRSIQNMALTCLASVFGTREPIQDVQKILDTVISSTSAQQAIIQPVSSINSTATTSNSTRDLLVLLFDLFNETHASVVRIEASIVLGHLAKNYPTVIQHYWKPTLVNLLNSAMVHSDQALRLSSIQIINSLTSSGHNELLESLDKDDSNKPTPAPTAANAAAQKKPIVDVMNADMWLVINKQLLSHAFRDSFQTVKAVAVAIYANIAPALFTNLYRETNFGTETINHILQAAKDKTASVRASACRTLGVFVTFPILRDNAQFIDDTNNHLQSLLHDEILNVRIRACWAVANLCDAMRQASWISLLHRDDLQGKELQEKLKYEKLVIHEALLVLNTSNDNEKVRANTVRALGNLASFAGSSVLAQSLLYSSSKKHYFVPAGDQTAVWKPKSVVAAESATLAAAQPTVNISLEQGIAQELINALTSSNVKVRWNSCYAIGNYLNNPVIKLPVDSVVNELCSALANDKNYKVRIQAAWALSFLRNAHGIKCENRVWEATLKSYVNASEATDYKEYKYVKTLMRQLRLTISHLLEIADLDHEEPDVKNTILQNAETTAIILHEELAYLNAEVKETSHIYQLCSKLLEWFQSRPSIGEANEAAVLSATQTLEKLIKFREQEHQQTFA